MTKLKGILTLVLLLAMLASPIAVLAVSDISGARYYGTIIVSNNSTIATNVAVNCTISTQALIDGGYLNSSANNCAVRSSGGSDIPFMPGANNTLPWGIWVGGIGQDSVQSNLLYTAESTGGEIRYFPGSDGANITDASSMEPADNFSFEVKGFINTAAGADKNLIEKGAAFATYIREAGNIVAGIDNTSNDNDLSYLVNDYAHKAAGAVFPAGATVSIEAWFYLDALSINIEAIVACGDENANWQNVRFGKASNNTFRFRLSNVPNNNYSCNWLSTDDIVATGWHLVTATYDAAATPEARVYMDGVEIAGADGGDGTNFHSPNARMTIGAMWKGAAYDYFWNGDIDEVRISDSVRTLAEHVTAYNGGVGVAFEVDGNTSSLWHFNEGAGNPADETGANDLINVGATWSTTSPVAGLSSAASVNASGVASGEHTVEVTANTTHLWMNIDGGAVEDIVALGGASVSNTADNWTIVEGEAVPYMEYYSHTVNGTLVSYIEWEYDDTTFQDSTAFNNDATPTFRTGTSDADVSAVLSSFLPIAEARAPAYALADAPDFIDADALTGNVTGTFTTVPTTGGFPLAGVITAMANATSTPPQLPLLIIAVFIILAFSLTVSATMRKYGSGSLIPKIIAITAVMGVFIGLGNFGIDDWMLYVFLVIAVAIAMASRQATWT